MASIHTLVEDIYRLIQSGNAKLDADRMAILLAKRAAEPKHVPMLRMSNFATPDKQLWFHINRPELAAPIEPWALIKFQYGHILEEYLLELAKQATDKNGEYHTVEGEQDELVLEGVTGHRDAVIDGVLVDVKSANSRSFSKFREHRLETEDSFGYLDQLSLYLESSREDPLVKVKNEGAFLAIDKELGHICLDFYTKKSTDYVSEIKRKRAMLASPNPPEHCCNPVPMGASGNYKLGTRCSYNPYKFHCHPGLRCFRYSYGPVYLTRVERLPDVPEVKEFK